LYMPLSSMSIQRRAYDFYLPPQAKPRRTMLKQ
jgi:hypothetical protein